MAPPQLLRPTGAARSTAAIPGCSSCRPAARRVALVRAAFLPRFGLPPLRRASNAKPAAGAKARGGRPAADPKSQWIVVDAPDSGTRHIVIAAPPALAARFGGSAAEQRRAAVADMVSFESTSLGARVDRGVYSEALALYDRLVPLVLDHLAANPSGRVRFSGEGVGGSLASLLALLSAARGLRPGALAPAVALNAPAVVAQVRDAGAWCAGGGGACSLEELGAMLDDAAARGVLSELGLPAGAVLNVYYNPDGSSAAAAAAAAASVSLGGGAGGEDGAPKAKAGVLKRLDAALLRQAGRSALVPEALKAWLRAGAGAGADAPGGEGAGTLHVLQPVGRVLWYEPAQPGSIGLGRASGARPA